MGQKSNTIYIYIVRVIRDKNNERWKDSDIMHGSVYVYVYVYVCVN